ncbi:MAG TPA: hypothetical protein VMS86_06880 [Thermoanaerobaculia bacterium]|nr:hypothetical protein [Thermoanaerobaculia bacterium]
MGIPRGSARLLLEEGKRRPFSGALLQLGRSSVYFTGRDLERWARRHGFALRPGVAETRSHDPRLAAQGCLDDRTFFARLGFDQVRASDISPWEGADHLFDLNQSIPAELAGRFDVVFETGTIVQIFHLPNVLANLHRLLKPGGRIIHCAVPSNNHMDLGFYMLSPTFFSDYYAANGYRIEAHYLCEYFAYWHQGRLHSDRWRVYEYHPGCLDALSYGRYGGPQAAIFLVATRTAESTCGAIPQLGQYRRMWRQHVSRDDEGARAAGHLLWPAKRVVESIRRRLLPRPMPKLVARY